MFRDATMRQKSSQELKDFRLIQSPASCTCTHLSTPVLTLRKDSSLYEKPPCISLDDSHNKNRVYNIMARMTRRRSGGSSCLRKHFALAEPSSVQAYLYMRVSERRRGGEPGDKSCSPLPLFLFKLSGSHLVCPSRACG